MNEEELRAVWRQYLQERVNQCGGVRRFGEIIGVSHGNVSRVLGGDGNVPEAWIVKIATKIGPSLPEIYAVIAVRCANASPKGSLQAYVPIPAPRTKGDVIAGAAAEVGEAAVAYRQAGQPPSVVESPSDELPHKGRTSHRPKGPRRS